MVESECSKPRDELEERMRMYCTENRANAQCTQTKAEMLTDKNNLQFNLPINPTTSVIFNHHIFQRACHIQLENTSDFYQGNAVLVEVLRLFEGRQFTTLG